MASSQEEMRPEAVTNKLSDKELLRNYCTFASLHRALASITLFKSLSSDELERRSIGLEILGNFAAALEDVALWFFTLKEWRKGGELLFDLLDRINIAEREGSPYSSERALSELSKWNIADLRRELGLPTDERLLEIGWTEKTLNSYINVLRDALEHLREALGARDESERVLVSSYNKVKHGALALAANEHSSIGVSVMLPSRRGPRDPVSGKRKINTGWIACEDEALRGLVDITVQVSSTIWTILSFIYKARFDPTWTGSVPSAIADWRTSTGQS